MGRRIKGSVSGRGEIPRALGYDSIIRGKSSIGKQKIGPAVHGEHRAVQGRGTAGAFVTRQVEDSDDEAAGHGGQLHGE